MTKKEVTDELKKIISGREDCQLFTFNSYRSLPTGAKYFVDHVIVMPDYVIFIEVKLGTDKLSDGQIRTGKQLSDISAKEGAVKYFLLTEPNAKFIFNYLRGFLWTIQ